MASNTNLDQTNASAEVNISNSGLGFSTFLTKEQLITYSANYNGKYVPKMQDKYVIVRKLGQGSFGEVFKVMLRTDYSKCFAIKSMNVNCNRAAGGCPVLAIREVKILKALKHNSVVNLIEVVKGPPSKLNNNMPHFFMVFEYCEFDLLNILRVKKYVLNAAERKWLLKQLLEGLLFIHGNHIMHRDLKASNILVNRAGNLKIADFGLARPFSSDATSVGRKRTYTTNVVTLWYRAPELLLGINTYNAKVDLWSYGCIFFEMFVKMPLFRSDSEAKQIEKIQSLCGSFDEYNWPGVTKKSNIVKTLEIKPRRRVLREKLCSLLNCPEALNLLDHCLALDFTKRICAFRALNHNYFWHEPLALNPAPKLALIEGEIREMMKRKLI